MAEQIDGQTGGQTNGQADGLIEEPAELFTVVTVTYPRSSLVGGARCHWIKAPTMNGDGDQERCWYLLGSDGSGYHWQDVVLGAAQVKVEALPAPAVDPVRDPSLDRAPDRAVD